MQWTYDPSVDALTIVFAPRRHASRTDELRPGMFMDVDDAGCPVALAFLDASTQFPREGLASLPLPKALIPLRDAAARAGLAPATLRQQIRNARLVATKWHREWWIDERELHAYLRSRAPQGRRSRRGTRLTDV